MHYAIALLLKIILVAVVLLIVVYTIRHYYFTLNRLFGRQRYPYLNVDTADWPSVTVLVPAHNEEAVIADSLLAFTRVSYPRDRIKVIIVNDRSNDNTGVIIDDFAARFPDLIIPFHRQEGIGGKAPALKDATERVESDIIIVFDADYIPGRGLIKQLVAPFFDPEVGLVMGRVVPVNLKSNLLTRLLDLERSGGYQVDQQARMNLGLVPQYGGTVGGVRMAALNDAGGWLDDTLAEDTDLTYRAILRGWKSVYQNRSECFEEAPETWPARIRQIQRWAKGHNQSLARYAAGCLDNDRMPRWQRFDGLLLLGVYAMSLVTIIGWIAAILLYYMGEDNIIMGPLSIMAVASYGSVGNFAAFFEIGAATYLDGGRRRLLLLPFNQANFFISMMAVCHATLAQIIHPPHKSGTWSKTPRFRTSDSLTGML
ncbi:MAG: glycosyltransferase [Pseudomonadota bacterium]|nr:glycosyltransferase [Pseudomonadota bacterium]